MKDDFLEWLNDYCLENNFNESSKHTHYFDDQYWVQLKEQLKNNI